MNICCSTIRRRLISAHLNASQLRQNDRDLSRNRSQQLQRWQRFSDSVITSLDEQMFCKHALIYLFGKLKAAWGHIQLVLALCSPDKCLLVITLSAHFVFHLVITLY